MFVLFGKNKRIYYLFIMYDILKNIYVLDFLPFNSASGISSRWTTYFVSE